MPNGTLKRRARWLRRSVNSLQFAHSAARLITEYREALAAAALFLEAVTGRRVIGMASPFSRALQRLIRRIESNGHTVIFGLVPEYEKGLDTVRINELAAAAGFHPIFETGETPNGDRWVRVSYPDPGEVPAEFITWSREPTAVKVRETCATTVDILREWVDVALQQPFGHGDPEVTGRTPESLATALARLIEILLTDRDALEHATTVDAANSDLQQRRRDWLTGITPGFSPMDGKTWEELSCLRPSIGSAQYKLVARIANAAAIREGAGNHVLPLIREAELAHDELIEVAHHEAYDQGKSLTVPQRHSDAVYALIALVPPPSPLASIEVLHSHHRRGTTYDSRRTSILADGELSNSRGPLTVTYRELSGLVGGLVSHKTIKNRMTKDRKAGTSVPAPVSSKNGRPSRYAYADILVWWPFDRNLPHEYEATQLLLAKGKSVQVGQPAK